MQRLKTFSLMMLCVLLAGSCGYHVATKRMDAGKGLTMAVPTFNNHTTTYRIEQRLTDALRQELVRKTQFSVRSAETGDVIVKGEVNSFNAVPVILSPQGRGSSYSIAVDIRIRVTDTRSNKVLFENDHWSFRDVFELAQTSGEFVPEDTAAMDRMARRFAESLTATILHAKP